MQESKYNHRVFMKLLPFKKQNKLKEEDARLNGSFQWRKPQVVIPTSLQQHLSLLGFEHLRNKTHFLEPLMVAGFERRKGESFLGFHLKNMIN